MILANVAMGVVCMREGKSQPALILDALDESRMAGSVRHCTAQ